MTEPARVTGTVRRHFVEHDHPSGLYTVSAHRVTKSTEGEVMVPEGGVRKVSAGDVLVATDRPDVYTVYPGAVFDEMSLRLRKIRRISNRTRWTFPKSQSSTRTNTTPLRCGGTSVLSIRPLRTDRKSTIALSQPNRKVTTDRA